VVATSSELESDLVDRSLDLAFLINPVGDPRLRLIPLGIQETTRAAAPSWNLGGAIRPADLQPLPIVSNPSPSPMYRQITAWFRAAGVEPARLSICTSVTVIAHLVASGVAIGFLPRKMIEAEIAAGTLQPLQARPPIEKAGLYAAYRSADTDRQVHAVIRAAQGVLEQVDFLTPA
jgi:DNA-binding transcriptional LysR family regulator